jgi:ABC-type Mn2+/Zn2+ transport system permease subunit
MPRSADPDTLRAFILLLAAIIGLVSVVLNIVHSRAKEVATPEAKRDIYRSVIGWTGTALWLIGLPISFRFGVGFIFYFWLPAYAIDCFLFLTSSDHGKLRLDIFKLIFSSQAITLTVVFYYAQSFLSLFDKLTQAFTGK